MMEPTIHLRQAKVGDIPAILEIEQECFQEDSFSREQFVYLICRSKGTFYVVVEQERMIAYVSLLFHAGTRYLRIYSIAVIRTAEEGSWDSCSWSGRLRQLLNVRRQRLRSK